MYIRSLTYFIIVSAFTVHSVMTAPANAQGLILSDRNEGTQILDFDFGIMTGGYAVTAAWSPNNQKLAFPLLSSLLMPKDVTGAPWVIDRDQRTLMQPIRGGSAHSPLAWSEDGKLFAFVPHDAEKKLIVTSSSDYKELAAWTNAYESYAQCRAIRELVFTDDGTAFWSTCYGQEIISNTGSTIAAIKISYPEFRILERATLSAPVSGRYNVLIKTRLQKFGGKPYLFSIIGSSTGKDEFGGHVLRIYVEAIPLFGERKSLARVDFDTKSDSGITRIPKWVDFSEDFKSVVVLFGGSSVSSGVTPRPELDRFFEIYDTKSNQKILTFGNELTLKTDVHSAAVIPGWKFLVASAGSREGGGIIVFSLQTGEVVQRRVRSSTSQVFLSSDGTRVAAGGDDKMLFYKVRQ